ncbi:MAG: helix-turn-helix domain-containing protein [Acidiphilium sp.]
MKNRIALNEKNAPLNVNAPPSNSMAVYVGRRIRRRRLFLELTQEQLAKQLGTTGTEIEKYESGTIRMDAGQIFELSQMLGVPLSFFFVDGHEEAPASELNDARFVRLTST